ncbi:DUF4249 domain-containing protein [Lacihabitans sp. LS3-19]|uniref:DUF4249 domain-containing protein n=1 Tax=Lacihabitans sp. LS3-19 TaxID=2487335 RepID=UPI0020CBAF86|nr:DUF4249 domain-containing protein [Lacihabitans sp. LS3-19]MCP9766675.1 DUF4249 domain-containing protein [Lacihabitans sp. LS3-19]
MIKNIHKPIWAIILSFVFFVSSCIDPIKVSVDASKSYLIVDGIISDLDEQQVISIFRTNKAANFASSEFTATIAPKSDDIFPVKEATVWVMENGSNKIDLFEYEPGYYKTPPGFVGKVGSEYALFFTTKEGEKYHSTAEKIVPVPEIATLLSKFNEKGIKDKSSNTGNISTHDIYIDFIDPAGEKNFYRWKWFSYEIQNICETCKQGRYYRSGTNLSPVGECIKDLSLPSINYFDYFCESLCWDIFLGSKIDIFSDLYTDGKTQYDKLVAQIPLYQSNPCLVVVQQYSMNPNAYRYLKLIEDQSVNTGTLADTPPAPIKGNVRNVNNESEIVLGYFGVSAVSEVRYMLNRAGDGSAIKDNLFKYQNKRDPIPEYESDERPIIPVAICKPSASRTAIAPRNWQFGR